MKERVDTLFPEALVADENLRELLETEDQLIYDSVYLEILVKHDENILPQIMSVMTHALSAKGCLAVIGIYGVSFRSLEACFLVDQQYVWGVALGREEVVLCTDGPLSESVGWNETLKLVGQRLFGKLHNIGIK